MVNSEDMMLKVKLFVGVILKLLLSNVDATNAEYSPGMVDTVRNTGANAFRLIRK